MGGLPSGFKISVGSPDPRYSRDLLSLTLHPPLNYVLAKQMALCMTTDDVYIGGWGGGSLSIIFKVSPCRPMMVISLLLNHLQIFYHIDSTPWNIIDVVTID